MKQKTPAGPFSPRAFLPMTMLSIEMWGMMAAVCCCSIGIAANISDASWGHGARIVSCFDAPTAPLARKQFIDVNPGCAPE